MYFLSSVDLNQMTVAASVKKDSEAVSKLT